MVINNAKSMMAQMREGLQPAEYPGYMQYWDARVQENPDFGLAARTVRSLARVALRGETDSIDVEFIRHNKPEWQARYWYRALGPLNPLNEVEPDLITACELMYSKSTYETKENDTLRLDSAYALAELARITRSPRTQISALRLAFDRVRDIENSPGFAGKPAIYRLQTTILSRDLNHDSIRLRDTGSLLPRPLTDKQKYREYEIAVVGQELQGIELFGEMVESGITEENFGILFEWYFTMAERHRAWSRHELDVAAVRGATGRENAQWLGDWINDRSLINANHDIVMTRYQEPGKPLQVTRPQLGTVRKNSVPHPQITPLDFQAVLRQRFVSIDQATRELSRNLARFRSDYLR